MLAALTACVVCGINCRAFADSPVVALVTDNRLGPPAAHGLEKLMTRPSGQGLAI